MIPEQYRFEFTSEPPIIADGEQTNLAVFRCMGYDADIPIAHLLAWLSPDRIVWLHNLKVRSQYRDQHIGTYLFQNLEEWSKSLGAEHIMLAISDYSDYEDPAKVAAMYERLMSEDPTRYAEVVLTSSCGEDPTAIYTWYVSQFGFYEMPSFDTHIRRLQCDL